MAENAVQRAQRLLDLVPYLKSNPGITVSEVSKHFGIAKSDVIKDLNLLFLCGLPGYTHLELLDISFEDEIISVIDAQNIGTPRALSEHEAITLRIALHSLLDALAPRDPRRATISALLEKISKTMHQPIPRGSIAVAQSHDQVLLSTLDEALARRVRVEITYINRAKDSRSVREVSPLRITSQEGKYSLVAWCHLSNALRTFHISQIEKMALTNVQAIHVTEEIDDEAKIAVVKIAHESEALHRDFPGAIIDNSHIRYFNSEWLLRIAMSYADQVEIISPGKERDELSARIKATLALYR